MRVRLTDATGQDRIVPSLALHGHSTLVRHGEVIDVPDEVAGRAPGWRSLDDDALPDGAVVFDVRYLDSEGNPVDESAEDHVRTEGYDYGAGLLAQTDVWTAADDDPGEDADDAGDDSNEQATDETDSGATDSDSQED